MLNGTVYIMTEHCQPRHSTGITNAALSTGRQNDQQGQTVIVVSNVVLNITAFCAFYAISEPLLNDIVLVFNSIN